MSAPTRYKHAEAFCLMTYRADDGSEEEVIWNSRDGVTPFVVTLRSGKPARHVDWHRDIRFPDYVPAPGSRIFVDVTPERLREKAEAFAAHWWDHPDYPASARFRSMEEFIDMLVAEWARPGAPDLIEVPS